MWFVQEKGVIEKLKYADLQFVADFSEILK